MLGVALVFAVSAFFGDEFAADGGGEEDGDEAEETDEDEGGDIHKCLALPGEVESSRDVARA